MENGNAAVVKIEESEKKDDDPGLWPPSEEGNEWPAEQPVPSAPPPPAVEAAAEKSEPAVTAEAEEPKPKPVRVCSKCGHPSGNSVGKIRFGRIVEARAEDGSKRYEIAPLCDPCAEAEKQLSPEELKPVFKIGYLISQIGDMNAQAQAFQAARGYWERVSRGIETPEVRKTPEGMLACGVQGCPRCHDKSDHAVEHFVVMRVGVVGICPLQAAALAKSGADLQFFVTKNWGEAKKRLAGEIARVKAFEAAKSAWELVDAGEAEVEVRVEETEDGDLVYKCGVKGCKCRERGDKPVENYVVLDGQPEMPVAGICKYQFAALKQSAAKLFASSNGDGMGLLRCAKHRRWLLSRADNAARAIQGRPPRPQDFDKVGGGLARFRPPAVAARLREEKKETLEERETKRRARQLARAKATNPRAGCGKKANKKGGGGKGGGKKR